MTLISNFLGFFLGEESGRNFKKINEEIVTMLGHGSSVF